MLEDGGEVMLLLARLPRILQQVQDNARAAVAVAATSPRTRSVCVCAYTINDKSRVCVCAQGGGEVMFLRCLASRAVATDNGAKLISFVRRMIYVIRVCVCICEIVCRGIVNE